MVVALIVWSSSIVYRQKPVVVQHALEQPDAILEDVTARMMNKEGKLTMKVVTPKMVHYAQDNTTYFTQPLVTLYRQSPEPWQISSTYAKAIQGIERIEFWENVVVHHPKDSANPMTLIKTPSLTVLINQQLAETNDKITLIQPNLVINAVGMNADMNTGEIKLLSEARGEYVPSS